MTWSTKGRSKSPWSFNTWSDGGTGDVSYTGRYRTLEGSSSKIKIIKGSSSKTNVLRGSD